MERIFSVARGENVRIAIARHRLFDGASCGANILCDTALETPSLTAQRLPYMPREPLNEEEKLC